MAIMKKRVRGDKAGRVVIPKPAQGAGPLTQERGGVWVLRTGRPLAAAATDATLEQIRAERGRRNLDGDRCRWLFQENS